jgi:hypothetical protein
MAAGDGKVPIGESVRAAFAFMTSSIAVLFPAAALVAVFSAAGQTLMSGAGQSAGQGAGQGAGALLFAISLIGNIAYAAFVLRLAIREDASGFFGLKLSADEARLIGVNVTLALFGIVIILVFSIVAVFLLSALIVQSGVDPAALEGDQEKAADLVRTLMGGPAGPIFIALAAALVALLLWLSVRLSLAMPATIGERRFMLLSTFAWTKGNSLRILAADVIVVLPLMMAAWIGASLAGLLANALAAGGAGAAALSPLGLAVFQFVFDLGVLTFVTPAQLALFAYLYKGLRPPSFGA